MTDSMVERVARGIYIANLRQTNPMFQGDAASSWQAQPESRKADFMLQARAAIAAMRTPTDAMIEAGASSGVSYDPMRGPSDDMSATGVWTAMIDTALEQRGLEG